MTCGLRVGNKSACLVVLGHSLPRRKPGSGSLSWLDSASIQLLLGSSEYARNYCDYSACPLGAWFGFLIHHGRIHTHSAGRRGCGDFVSGYSRPALVTNAPCVSFEATDMQSVCLFAVSVSPDSPPLTLTSQVDLKNRKHHQSADSHPHIRLLAHILCACPWQHFKSAEQPGTPGLDMRIPATQGILKNIPGNSVIRNGCDYFT